MLLQVLSPPIYMLRISRTSSDPYTNYFGFRLKPGIHPRGYALNARRETASWNSESEELVELVCRCVMVWETKGDYCSGKCPLLVERTDMDSVSARRHFSRWKHTWLEGLKPTSSRSASLITVPLSCLTVCSPDNLCFSCLNFSFRNQQRVRVYWPCCNCLLCITLSPESSTWM